MKILNIFKISTIIVFFFSTFILSQNEVIKSDSFYKLSLTVNVDTSEFITFKNELNALENELKLKNKKINSIKYNDILKKIIYSLEKLNIKEYPKEYLISLDNTDDFDLMYLNYYNSYIHQNKFSKADSVFKKIESKNTLNQNKSFLYYYRFHQKMMQKEYINAQKNLTKFMINAGTFYQMDTLYISYAQIWQYLLDIKLSLFYKSSHSNVIEIEKNWNSLLTNYILNKIEENEVLNYINDEKNNRKKREYLTEILFFTALEYIFSNKEKESLKYLKEVIRLQIYNFVEFKHANYLLKNN
ncbi:MAG: hypothetical protein EAZ27_03640 [Cytophagales bacterium]|nr:MAG: hypothetical protein EAZ27_03640 [Cytophagales bacterium]